MMTKMTELNRELLLDELSNFEQKKSGEIPVILNKYLESIAQNGDTMFSWNKLQPLLKRKLELVMIEFNELCPTDHLIPLPNVRPFDFEELKQQILTSIDCFCSAPFTVQRICELITNPSKHYKRTDKFMRGIEKNILVVTTIEPKSADGSSPQITTSSFKTLFSSLHSVANSSSSLTTPSTSLLVNGMADVICDQQMAINCSNDSDLHHLSSPVSPNSMPLSTPSTNSPPNHHLAPLQQLDSFTTVFATTPSTPLSVVSDLHPYDHSSSLSLMTTSGENHLSSSSSSSSDSKITETYFETNSQIDSETISSSNKTIEDINDNSLQPNTSTEVTAETKVDFNKNLSKEDSNESKQTNSNQTNDDSEDDKELTQKTINDSNIEILDESKDNTIEKTPIINETKVTEILSESSVPIISNENNEIVKTDNTSNEKLDDISVISSENKPLVEELINESQNRQTIENIENNNNNQIRITTDEEMSQPMEDNANTGNNGDNNTDMTDCCERPNDLTAEVMDHTLSQSDQSEPMDED